MGNKFFTEGICLNHMPQYAVIVKAGTLSVNYETKREQHVACPT